PASAGLAASSSSGSSHLLTLARLDELAAEVLLKGLDDGIFAERGGGGRGGCGLFVGGNLDLRAAAEELARDLVEQRLRIANALGREAVGKRGAHDVPLERKGGVREIRARARPRLLHALQ